MPPTLQPQQTIIETLEITSWSSLSAAIAKAVGSPPGASIDQQVNVLLGFMQWPGRAVVREGFLFFSCSTLVITSTPQVIAHIVAANRTGRF
jgi:hypothetical protein